MAWIESHQDLKEHPKVSDLMAAMGWDLDTTLGKLHRFWWWCVDYAEDGDLRKHNDNRIAQAMGVAIADARRLVEAMVAACWLDRKPYFRVHDWWDYFGNFLYVKYKASPEKWRRVKQLYLSATEDQAGNENRGSHGGNNGGNNGENPVVFAEPNLPNQPNKEALSPRAREADAEIPSWKEFWDYCQSLECGLAAEWFARDKWEAANSENWKRLPNWRAYARRCRGWWESDGRPMAAPSKARNGNGKAQLTPDYDKGF